MALPEFALTEQPVLAAVITAVRLFLPGWAWRWTFSQPGEPGAASRPALLLVAESVGLSLAINGVLGLLLGALGVFRPGWLHGGVLVLTVLGLALGRWRKRTPEPGRASLVGFAALALLLVLCPGRTDWVVGGRDPGLYVGEGLRLARTGTLAPKPDAFLASLSPRERAVFCQNRFGFDEVLPVIPVQAATMGERPFFFPLTSVYVAALALDGGLESARRFPWFHCLIAGLALVGFLARVGCGGPALAAGLLAWFAQPVVAYHANLPLSEYVEIALVLFALPVLSRKGTGAWAWLAVFLFLAVCNRLSFFIFGGLLLVVHAARCGGKACDSPGTFSWLAWLGLLLGAGVAMFSSPYALLRLDGQAREVLIFGAALLALHLVLARAAPVRRWSDRIPDGLALGLAAVLLLVLALLRKGKLDRIALALGAAGPFTGWTIFLAGLAGVALFLRTGGRESPLFRLALLYFAVVSLIIVSRFEIATDFPWASRRYLLCFSPLLALGVAHLTERLTRFGRVWLAVPPILVIPLGLCWRGAPSFPFEYRGLTPVLKQIADRLPPNALVVADHFVWGTPLRMLHGVDVLDGEWLRETQGQEAALAVLQQSGREVWLLTSVAGGHAWVDFAKAEAVPVGAAIPFDYPVMKSHRDLRSFQSETKHKHFQLYRWHPKALP